MKKPKLTPWFPADVKPVRKGTYRTDLAGYVGYSFWSGHAWSDTALSVADAQRVKKNEGMQKKRWRGLAQKP